MWIVYLVLILLFSYFGDQVESEVYEDSARGRQLRKELELQDWYESEIAPRR